MFARTDAGQGTCNAFAGYLQKFVVSTADQQQLLEIAAEFQTALWMQEYLGDADVLLRARKRYKKSCRKKLFTPDDFEDYVHNEPSESDARQYLTGLVAHFNSLEDYVFTPLDLDCSRQIVLAGVVIRNRSVRLIETVLSIIAVNSELMDQRAGSCQLKLAANMA